MPPFPSRDLEYGRRGHRYISSGGQSPSGNDADDFWYFEVLEDDTVVTYNDGFDDHTNVTLHNGHKVYCDGDVTVSAGRVIAYIKTRPD